MKSNLKIMIRVNDYDTFSFELFLSTINKIDRPNTAIYTSSFILESSFINNEILKREEKFYYNQKGVQTLQQIVEQDTTNLIILGIKDHLSGNDYTYDAPMEIVDQIRDLARKHYDKQFILITSVEFLDAHLNESNLVICRWGGDNLNQMKQYKTLPYVVDKNFDTKYSYLSLNRNPRGHRHLLIALLYGLDLENYGLISWIRHSCPIYGDFLWQEQYNSSNYKNYFKQGLEKLKESQQELLAISEDDASYEIYPEFTGCDNATNFKNKLSNYYRNTFVEIVPETTFKEPTLLLTEKMKNAFYGCNFPIFISCCNTVSFLREMGLDVYDDIIDHSYDTITNPTERIYMAVTKNIRLLKDLDYTKQLWRDNYDRIVNNAEFMREKMFDFYRDRYYKDLEIAISKLH